MGCELEAVGRYHILEGPRIKIRASAARTLVERHYGVVGHAAVELCKWTKDAIEGGKSCYKVKFYNAPAGGSHRCVEMSPVGLICSNRCVYCWRPTEEFDVVKLDERHYMEPEEMTRGVLEERKRLLSGYWGHPRGRLKVREALMPTHWAISLSGEPTMYPKLPQLVKAIKSLPHTKSIFLVTNGQHPEILRKLMEEDALPTQLYLSTNAPNEELYYKINVPVAHREDAWRRWLESLDLLAKMPTRTVLRITLVRSLNYDERYIPQFAQIIERGSPHFVEIKSYMHLGHSTYRLKREDMLTHGEVVGWASKLLRKLPGFRYMDDDEPSRIVVIQNMERYVDRWIVSP
ncbi:MAG: 4-demethylwyosine synthase TYW1 [Pyrobaculum sp.]